MKKSEIMKFALIDAFSTAFYVSAVALFIYFGGEGLFGQKDTAFIPIIMLMLLVFSVALVGFLIFGKPILWYLNNKKKEAISLLFYTLGTFFTIILLVLFFLIMLSSL